MLLEIVRDSHADEDRSSLIQTIRDAHADRKIVAFSQYSDTVDALFTALSRDGNVGALTGSGGRVAGGAISRIDALAGFAPEAMGCRPPHASDNIRLLLATDLVSEGVNLQDAGVVIHLDLPWTAARMEQRLGRVARIGSRHERVQSYALLPPASAEEIVRIECVLRKKIEAAGIVESSFRALGGWLDDALIDTPDPEVTEEARDVLRRWMAGPPTNGQVAAIVSSRVNGFLAVSVEGALTRTIVQIGERIGESPQLLREALAHCAGTELAADRGLVAKAEAQVNAWLTADSAMSAARSPTGFKAGVRAIAIRRIQKSVRCSPLHKRAGIAARSEQALEILQGNLGLHDEMEIGRLCATITDDEMLLDRIMNIGRGSRSHLTPTPDVLAMIVLTRR
jgi:hypothetical protein